MSWVTKKKAAEKLGLTEGQIRSKIARKWKRGIHYAIIDGGTWINIGEVQKWITREASGQCEGASRSDTPLGNSGTKKRSTSSRLNLV